MWLPESSTWNTPWSLTNISIWGEIWGFWNWTWAQRIWDIQSERNIERVRGQATRALHPWTRVCFCIPEESGGILSQDVSGVAEGAGDTPPSFTSSYSLSQDWPALWNCKKCTFLETSKRVHSWGRSGDLSSLEVGPGGINPLALHCAPIAPPDGPLGQDLKQPHTGYHSQVADIWSPENTQLIPAWQPQGVWVTPNSSPPSPWLWGHDS